MKRLSLPILFIALLGFNSLGHAAKIVTAAVAQVSDHVVTSREVQISFALDKMLDTKLINLKHVSKNSWLLDPKTSAFQKHLAQVLLEMVVNFEAENFSIGDVDPIQAKNFLNHVDTVTKDWAEWKTLEVKPVEIEQMVKRKLRAKNFLKFKAESSGIVISDDEAKSYFEKNKSKFGNLPFSQFQSSIKDYLAQNQQEEKLKDWFEILKRKYRVKTLSQVE